MKNKNLENSYSILLNIILETNPKKVLIMNCGNGEDVYIINTFCEVECYGFGKQEEINLCQYKEIYNKLVSTFDFKKDDFDLIIMFDIKEKNLDLTLKQMKELTKRYIVFEVKETTKSREWWENKIGNYFSIFRLKNYIPRNLFVGEK